MAETLIPNCTQRIPSHLPSPVRQFPLPIQSLRTNSNPNSPVRSLLARHRPLPASPSPAVETKRDDDEESVSIDALRRFIELNLGKWNGTFYQFDAYGNLLQEVSTKLAVSSYGEDELISLIQSLYIKQPCGSGDDGEAEWFEYKIKETNMFTVDKYQQIGLFPKEKAFALRYQTAGMLETVLRQGVLGEDDTGEESPKNLKLPSKRPSVICENCLYSLKRDIRARAFHVMDPKGILEMLIVFIEARGEDVPLISSTEISGSLRVTEISNRITPLLGRWEGHSITKRSGIYGATIEEAQTVALLEMDDEDRLVQDITSTSGSTGTRTNVHWTGKVSNNLVTFDGGFQVSLLPGGMYMGCPSDIAKSVAQLQSFHLEFCWMESADKRQRLVRTYDMEGLAVSSTYISETKV